MKTSSSQNPFFNRSLKLLNTLSIVAAILLLVSSILGIWLRIMIYPTPELLKTFVSNDVANLLIGLPILIISMAAAQRGSLVGLLCWPGALLYIFYNTLVYSLAMPFSPFFLIYPLQAIISAAGIILFIKHTAGEKIKGRLEGHLKEKFSGIVLIGMGALFFVRALGVLITSIINQTSLPGTELALQITDLIITPLWIVGGISLWRHQSFGYRFGLATLFQANSLFLGLILFMLLQPWLASTPIIMTDLVVILGMAVVALIPLVLVLTGASKAKHG